MRRVLLALLLVLVVAPAASASVLNYCKTSSGTTVWCHQHTRVFTYSIAPGMPSWWASAIDKAAAQWSSRSAVLELRKITGSAHITYRAVSNSGAVGVAHVHYHAPGIIDLNTARLSGSLTTQLLGQPEAIACHETGHMLGLGHGGTGCMSTNRQDGDGGEEGLRLAVDQRHPGADDVALLDRTYPATGH